MYKYVFPLHLPRQSLAMLGLIQPIGSVSPISELQARWAAAVFAGRCSLPPREQQAVDVDAKRRAMRRQYVKSPRHTIQASASERSS